MRFKQILFIALSLWLFFLTPAATLAINTDTSSPESRLENRLEKRVEAKENLLEKRTSSREALIKAREEMLAKFKQQREEFKTKLQTIRDEKKKALVEKIDTKLATINKNRTDHMNAILGKLTSILDKLAKRTEEGKAAGKDVTAIKSAIESARSAIASAQSAVSAQAEKEYAITISDETALKGAVGATIKQLEADLQSVQKTVIAAKQAVQNILAEIGKIKISPAVASPSAAVTQ